MRRILVGFLVALVILPVLAATALAERGPDIPPPWDSTMMSRSLR